MLKDTLQADLKSAMLTRDSEKVEVLKSLKSAILYAEVEQGKREEGLSDTEILAVFKKEAKKRQEAADLYKQGGNQASADKELSEKEIIDIYLPEMLDETATAELINEVMQLQSITKPTKQDMGKIIGGVKAKGGEQVDGALVAKLVQQRIAAA